MQKFGVIGGGAWGTALALSLIRAGRDPILWLRDPKTVSAINTQHENFTRLPGIKLDPRLYATTDISKLATCDVWILAIPAQLTQSFSRELDLLAGAAHVPLVLAAKGIEEGSSRLLSDIIAAEMPGRPYAILSGPSFAREVAHGLPTALTLATAVGGLGEKLALAMASPTLRLYVTDDVIGAQIGGAVKNVLAIACGIVTGRAMGENARAALMTRGLAELIRFGAAMKARPETLMGLSGLGDLVLTCSSPQSRNWAFGFALGQGKSILDILATQKGVTEGVTTAPATLELAKKIGVDMPIVTAVDAIINHQAVIDEVITQLLSRPLKNEIA